MSTNERIEDNLKKIKEVKLYTEEQVIKLLIECKDRFGGSELYDYVSDKEVIEWFNNKNI